MLQQNNKLLKIKLHYSDADVVVVVVTAKPRRTERSIVGTGRRGEKRRTGSRQADQKDQSEKSKEESGS